MLKNILLVDDDEDDREFFLQVLNGLRRDVNCVSAINGRDALEKLAGYRPDIIFLDLNMPLMNGRQFLQKVKQMKDFRSIPVVILTTSSDRESIVETRRLGASDFLTKPDKLSGWEKLLSKILKDPGLSSNAGRDDRHE